MYPIIMPVYSALTCSIILTSLIVLPTAFPDVSVGQILLAIQIRKVATEFSVSASPSTSVFFNDHFPNFTCPILPVIRLQIIYSIATSVRLSKKPYVLVLDLHGGFKILDS
eukprot:8487829-Heterocapsa_arctica.AAC.1